MTEFQLGNGLRVVVRRRGTIPLVALRLVVMAGSASDPKGKAGLSDFTAHLLRRGTQDHSVDELNESVEFVGADLSLGSAEDYMSLRAVTPSEHLGRMLKTLGEVVRSPSFPAAEFESEKERLLAQLGNDLDDPEALADRAMLSALWGDHPYGHDVAGNRRDVRSFTRGDVVRFHAQQMGPQVSTLYIVGAVELSKARALVEKAFGRWTGGPAAVRWPKATPLPPLGSVLVVDKPEQTQSQVRLSAPAFARRAKEFFPGVALNAVLGAGFTSRLMNEIRVNRGLSYGARSGFETMKLGGSFFISTFTKTESTAEIIRVALDEVKKLRTRGFRPGELKAAQKYVAGVYPLRLETNDALAGVLGDIDFYGLGADWVEKYRERIQAVTPNDAMAVAARYLFPEPPTLVVVGNAAKVAPQVAKFGKVTVVKPAAVR